MTDNTPFKTLEQAAEHFQVSESTFRKWVRSGHIPKSTYLCVNSVYRFNLPAVEAALMQAQTPNEGEDK